MPLAKLEPIRGGSLGGLVIDAIRDAIYSGRFQPGEPVRELQLARELRVSQTTVREALLQLEHDGLVVREANRGTRVTTLEENEIRERVEVRIVLETSAALDAARRFSPAGLAELSIRMQRIADAVRRNEYFEVAQADLAFHRLIWETSGNKTLYRLLDQLTAPLFAFLSIRNSGDLADLRRRVQSHEPIFEALASRKVVKVRGAVRQHLLVTYRQYLEGTSVEGNHGSNQSERRPRHR